MIDLELAKAHLRVDGSAEDALIQSYIDAAAAWVEGFTGRLLTRREVTQTLASFGDYVPLWWGPDPDFDTLTIDYLDSDGQAATVTDPRGVRDRVYAPLGGWPSVLDHSAIAVTYTAGYDEDASAPDPAAVPADLVQAQLMLVAHWYMNREAVNGGAANEVPLGVEAICRRYRPVLI